MTEPASPIYRAQQLRARGQFTEALALLLDLHRREPSALVSYEIACTYDPQGLEDDAIPFYERALELGLEGESLRGCLLGLGSSYRCVERYGDAIRTLQKGAAAFPDAREFDIFLALARYNVGEHSESMRLLLNHVAEYSADPSVERFKRAIAYYAENLDPPYNE